jgi:hypothetical protein
MKTAPLGCLLLVLSILALPLAAQPHRPEPRVVVYADPGFRGESLAFDPGTAIGDLRDLAFPSGRKINDKISSIRLEGGARVVLFADPGYSGDRIELTESVRDLRQLPRSADGRWTWDDCITSLRVPGRAAEHHARDPRWRRPPEREAGAVLYSAPNFVGETLWLEAGTTIEDLRDLTFESGRKVNDKVSSIRLEGGVRVTLFADPRFTGDRVELTESAPDLRQLPRSPGRRESWDDCITAVRVSRGGGNRPDGDRDKDREIEQLITRIYREVLHRPPTPEELLIFDRKYREHRWNERQLRDAIREHNEDRPGLPPRH